MKNIQKGRRKVLQAGIIGFCAALFAGLPKISFAHSGTNGRKGILVRADEGTHILTGRRKVPITVKISKAKDGVEGLSFCVEEQTPGRTMRVHKHLYHDELIFIHKGEGTLTLDEEKIHVATGDVVFIPRNTWHGLDNTGSGIMQMVFQYSPAGFEEFFIENGTVAGMAAKDRTEAEYAATGEKYGMVFKDNVNK